MLLGLLAVINAYIFVWRDEGSLHDLGALPAASLGAARAAGPLRPLAEPRADACTGHPVRIFEGLDDALHVETGLAGARSLRLALLGLGVGPEDVTRVEAAVRRRVDLGLIARSAAPVRAALDRFGGVLALEIELAEGHLVQACRADAGFRVRHIQHPLRTDVVVVGVTLGRRPDLEAALAEVGEGPALARAVARVLAQDVDLATQLTPGDRLQVMVEKRWLGSEFHRYGRVLAVRFLGAGARVAYYRYKPPRGHEALFDRAGRPATRTLLRSPVAYFPLPVQARPLLTPRVEIVEGVRGAVYRVPEGAPIHALGDGVVRAVGEHPTAGLVVEIRFDDGTVARHAHLARTVGEIEPGTRLRQGQVFALAGHSGRTPYPRLRLELWREDGGTRVAVDPGILAARGESRPPRVGTPLAQDQLERFRTEVRPWARALRQAS